MITGVQLPSLGCVKVQGSRFKVSVQGFSLIFERHRQSDYPLSFSRTAATMLGLTKLVRQGTFQPVIITAIFLSSIGYCFEYPHLIHGYTEAGSHLGIFAKYSRFYKGEEAKE
eukprot:m.23438 g.23438  ORF g.23438 m.23438 type:complete len:113 (+) comp10979_c0_seq1:2202-2540(+)